MAIQGEVHWHEGLFLQPHHLQAQQRLFMEALREERRRLRPYPWGVIESRLSTDALENMMVRFDRLHVVMPSGVVVDYPGGAELPPLEIKKKFESDTAGFMVYLGVPLWYSNRANTIEPGRDEDWRARKIFRVVEAELPDENSGENRQPMQFRKINARLMFEHEDRTDMEVVPLVRIVHAAGEDVGLPRLDTNFIPACFSITGSPTLREALRDLANALEASRRETVVQMTRAGFSADTMRGTQFQQMLRLKTLNRFAGRLPSLVVAPGISPFDMYLELRELLGELTSLQPDRDAFDVPAYDHDSPAVPFMDLLQKVRSLLKPMKGDLFRKVPFNRDGPTLLAKLSDQDLVAGNEYFLGIKTRQDPRAVASLVEDEDKFKMMAKSMWQARIRGIKLTEERHPPVILPAETGLHYYRLNRTESARMWDRIVQEREVAIWWPEIDAADFKVTLYMTVPDAKA